MGTPLTSLRNIGPAVEAALNEVGITTAETLRELGTDGAYAKMMAQGTKPHFIMFYALEMSLQERPWNDCKGAEKDALRARFDALKTKHFDTDLDHFEAVLDAIGVLKRKTAP